MRDKCKPAGGSSLTSVGYRARVNKTGSHGPYVSLFKLQTKLKTINLLNIFSIQLFWKIQLLYDLIAKFEFRIFRLFGVLHWHIRPRKHLGAGPPPYVSNYSWSDPKPWKDLQAYLSIFSHAVWDPTTVLNIFCPAKWLPVSLFLGPSITHTGDGLRKTGLEAGQVYLEI